MFVLLFIIAIVVCVLLGVIVLIQNPKGGGLSSNFSSSSQLMGVQRTGDFLEKGTWILAITLMVISLAMNVTSKSTSAGDSQTEQNKTIKHISTPINSGGGATSTPLPITPAPTSNAPAQSTPNKTK